MCSIQFFRKILLLSFALFFISINISSAQNYQDSNFEFASSFNPVGSGARAMGMGGAFIAVADDATASSWNPAGLIQLLYPEASYVYNHTRRKEKNSFNTIDAGGTHHFDVFTNSSDEVNTNFVSFLYPIHLMRRNMIFSISTQCLYDFNRNWNFNIDRSSFVDHWQYNQQGNLSALSFSYCIQVQSGLSIGATLNVWDDDITSNSWVQDYKRNAILNNGKSDYQLVKREEFVLKALNANFGILWRVNENLQVGAVLKTPFNADIKRQSFSYELFPETNETKSNTSQFEETIIMPMSYGIGMSYKVNEQFSLSGDIYQTKWNHFEYIKYDQQRISAIQLSMNQSQIDPAIHLRLGMDYKLRDANKAIWYPLRAGLFYDPIASQKNPDDMYGASVGFGVTKAEYFSFDMAYQYRHGKDLFDYMVKGMDFSQEINEHLIYLSLILYYGS